jgi:hypothetical protein
MQSAMNQFNSNMKAVKEMETLYSYLINDPKLPPCDLSNILRAQWVYAVSALDKLIHELVKLGMLQAFVGKRTKTSKFNSFSISLKTHLEIQKVIQSTNTLPSQLSEYFCEQEIINKHKFLAFQEPDKIRDALSLIWEETHKWQKIALSLNMSDDQVTKELKRIVTRRNQIVHEADIDLQTNLRGSINETEVRETVEFILKLGESIFNAVSSSP